MNRPQLIVITPVRNEAWVLEAFLTHCSSWADRIIIADQHSTDGSREIAAQFPKVTLIDNPTTEWIEYECRATLLKEVDKIKGDKIIFALDADEFLSDGFLHTKGWQQIIQSIPNHVFELRWFNLYRDFHHGEVEGAGSEWIAHYTEDTNLEDEYRKLEHNAVHCSRVPCLPVERCNYTPIEDFRFVHLGELNQLRNRNKQQFYQIVNLDKNPHKSNPVSLYRTAAKINTKSLPALDSEVPLTTADGRDITSLVRTSDHGQHYIDEIAAILRREGFKKFQKLCIWDNPDLIKAGIAYRPPLYIRIIHSYLRITQKHSRNPIIRAIDKLLKNTVF